MIFCAWGSNYTQCKDFQTQTYSIDGSLSYLSYDFIADSRKIKDKELEKKHSSRPSRKLEKIQPYKEKKDS